MVISRFILIWISLVIIHNWSFENPTNERINGLNFVAPPKPFQSDPMMEVKTVKANWIAVIPFAFSRLGTPNVRHNTSNYQWWGETPEGVIETVERAHQNQINVMLKPQLWVPRSWPGAIDFDTDQSWREWEKSYRDYILLYANIADSLNVELFCVGTELRTSAIERPYFWKNLISEIRSFYSGKIVYAANWDAYEKIPFWKDLDFIGIDAYFPLDSARTPEVSQLIQAWKPISARMERLSKSTDRPIIFTEYGYLSVDYCADKNWELEKRIQTLNINQTAQANSLEALYQVFYTKDYWQGGFLWKWFPNMEGHEGYPDRDYTPQGKQAEEVIKTWFGL